MDWDYFERFIVYSECAKRLTEEATSGEDSDIEADFEEGKVSEDGRLETK